MKYSKSIEQFIIEYAQADVNALRLKNIQADFDVAWAILQIEARKKIRTKLPLWAENPDVVFPSVLSTEQCSSELTARYKQELIGTGDLVDLTGGLGVDSFYFSQKASQVVYVERFPEYCQAAEQNFKALNATNIQVVQGDCTHFLAQNTHVFQTLFIDPARRGNENKRLFSLSECEPNVVELLPQLTQWGKRIIIKVSPMADLSAMVALLPCITEIHVVSVKNECKELLAVIENDISKIHPGGLQVHCVQIESNESDSRFTFSPNQERQLPHSTGCITLGKYLYEPNASILKAGAYKSISTQFGINKLQINSHLYTSDKYLPEFPGRKFEIVEVIPFNSKNLKSVGKLYPQANLSTRNFSLSPVELQKKLKIKDGGEYYLFATTLGNNDKVMLVGRKAN